MSYVPTIGLEIHAELKTRTKMFCRSKNDPEAAPNQNICPVCMAHPGTLPVINKEAVKHVLKVGLSLGSTLADYTEFDRKNYFYPDLPKGYQLSQYEYPLVSGGELANVAITRVHLEEDTASSAHDEGGGATTIDYNRAGVPLMELVTEPVIRSAEDAGRFARELQLLLRYLGASNANMEKGEMRVEANVSVSDNDALGTKVEIKNLNSFRAMERAVAYEIKRQTELLERGETVVQETRGWDETKQSTFAQRIKEGSADYRYFPDPDLPSLKLSEIDAFSHESLAQELPELPWQRRGRYIQMGIKADDAELYVRSSGLALFFESITEGLDRDSVLLANNYIANDLVSILRENEESIRDTESRDSESQGKITTSPENFKKLIAMIRDRKVSSRSAKDILRIMALNDQDPLAIATEKELIQESDSGALEAVVDRIIAQNASVAADYRGGKAAALEYLLGQCMRELRGAGDPSVLRQLLKSKISG